MSFCLVGPDGIFGRRTEDEEGGKGALCKDGCWLVHWRIRHQFSSWLRPTITIGGRQALGELCRRTSSCELVIKSTRQRAMQRQTCTFTTWQNKGPVFYTTVAACNKHLLEGPNKALPEIYHDMYEWYEGQKAPKIWRDAFANYAPLSMTARDLEKEHFAM